MKTKVDWGRVMLWLFWWGVITVALFIWSNIHDS